MSDPSSKCVVVVGPTATGKTQVAVALARRFSGEIVSADSRQVYRGLTIGTGKDLDAYGSGDSAVPYHLIDVADPDEEYHLYRFVADAHAAIADIRNRCRLPIIAGGTPLYVNALLDNYLLEGSAPDPSLRQELETVPDAELLRRLEDLAPDLHARVDRTQRKRLLRAMEIAVTRKASPAPHWPRLNPILLAPYYPRTVVHARIEKRLDERLGQGMIEEVQDLHDQGLSWERLEAFGLEYRYVSHFLRNQITRTQMRETLLARIRRFCKSQDIWYRKMERQGKTIHWIPGGDLAAAEALVDAFLQDRDVPAPELRLMDIHYGPRTS